MRRSRSFSLVLLVFLTTTSLAWAVEDSLRVRRVGQITVGGGVGDLAIAGNYAYVAAFDLHGMAIYDLSIPTAPVQAGYFYSYFARAVAANGSYAYVTYDDVMWDGMDNDHVQIVDVSNPAAPVQRGAFQTIVGSYAIAVNGSYVYCGQGGYGVAIVNVSNPSAPAGAGTCSVGAADIAIGGDYAYFAAGTGGLRIFNVSDPVHPVAVSAFTFPIAPYPYAESVTRLTVSGSMAYVVTDAGLRFLDVSNPAAPVLRGSYPLTAPAEDVIVRDGFLFLSNYTRGLRVLDVRNPAAPQEIGYYTTAAAAGVLDFYGPYVVLAAGTTLNLFDCSAALEHVLPVELLGLTATAGDSRVTLAWQTAAEPGNERFEIVRDGALAQSLAGHPNSPSEQRYAWTDAGLVNGRTYHYTLFSIATSGEREELESVEATPTATGTPVVTAYALHAAYPNPFNPTTTIAYDLPEPGFVRLAFFNVAGQCVATLVNGPAGAGAHRVVFDAGDLPSGMYLCRMDAENFHATQKLLLMK